MAPDPVPAARPSRSIGRGERVATDVLQDDFGWALGVVLRRYLGAAEEAVRGIPGGPRGYQVVASASQNLATNQGVLAAHLGIDRTVLTYLIDDLEAAGLVSRQPDPADRRSRRVVATEAGLALWQERRAALARVEADMLATLGDEAAAFKDLLQRVAKCVDQPNPTHSACQVAEELCAGEARPDSRTAR